MTRPTYLTTFRVSKNFNPTPIDRVNNFILNYIRLTYKYYILLETSGQGLGMTSEKIKSEKQDFGPKGR